MKKTIIILLLVSALQGQNNIIFPGLSGQQLLDSLVANYKTNAVLSYTQARDTLFANIETRNDSMSCVYTGYTIYMDPTQDPTVWAYNLSHPLN